MTAGTILALLAILFVSAALLAWARNANRPPLARTAGRIDDDLILARRHSLSSDTMRAVNAFDLSPALRRWMEKDGVAPERAALVEREFRRFFTLAATERGILGMPSREVDALWHAVLLDTRLYDSLCAAAGRRVHHSPGEGGASADDRFERAYKGFFGQTPPREVWTLLPPPPPEPARESRSQSSRGGQRGYVSGSSSGDDGGAAAILATSHIHSSGGGGWSSGTSDSSSSCSSSSSSCGGGGGCGAG